MLTDIPSNHNFRFRNELTLCALLSFISPTERTHSSLDKYNTHELIWGGASHADNDLYTLVLLTYMRSVDLMEGLKGMENPDHYTVILLSVGLGNSRDFFLAKPWAIWAKKKKCFLEILTNPIIKR